MALYRYVKSTITVENKASRQSRLIPSFFIVLGVFFLSNVIYPFFNYHFFLTSRFEKKLLSPLSESLEINSSSVLTENQDLTMISNWFPEIQRQIQPSSKIVYYTLSIPKLKIFDARVKIGGKSLRENLVHYGGTALPGEFGNTVIFGHSVLPQFFNPKNYMTIFATLPTLEKGDEILINFDGVEYRYQVYQLVEADPSDLSILEQRYDDSYLTLVTCIPPGTYWKRLAVRAKLEKI